MLLQQKVLICLTEYNKTMSQLFLDILTLAITTGTVLIYCTASQRRPKLEDYYQPSDEMKRYAMLTMGILGVGGAYGLTRIYHRSQNRKRRQHIRKRC